MLKSVLNTLTESAHQLERMKYWLLLCVYFYLCHSHAHCLSVSLSLSLCVCMFMCIKCYIVVVLFCLYFELKSDECIILRTASVSVFVCVCVFSLCSVSMKVYARLAIMEKKRDKVTNISQFLFCVIHFLYTNAVCVCVTQTAVQTAIYLYWPKRLYAYTAAAR